MTLFGSGARAPRALIAFALPFALFACTLYPGVGGRVNHGDSAKFQFIGVVAGISHPPGNPLYMVFNVLFAHVPIGAPFARASLLSAVFGALAVALIAASAYRMRGLFAATVSGSMLALGSLFWTLSTEAEVYTLNAALLAATVYALCLWEKERGENWLLVGLFAFVLAFANHLTMVAALPALAFAALRVARVRPLGRRVYLTGALASLLVVTLYAYIPLRYYDALYSEFDGALGPRSLWGYVTARKFGGNFGAPTVAALVHERIPRLGTFLGKQWLWPVWILTALGLGRAVATTRVVGGFVVLALVGFLAFAALYEIPDADGFYVPVVCLAALSFAFVVPARAEMMPLLALALAVWVEPAVAAHLGEWRKLENRAMVETLGDDPPVLWDLPDLVERVPEGAEIVLPCHHYGCVETWNYFRFGDETARRRKLAWVQLEGGADYGWTASQPHTISPSEATSRAVCTLRSADADRMRAAGARVETISRADKTVANHVYAGTPIWCSHPEPPRVVVR